MYDANDNSDTYLQAVQWDGEADVWFLCATFVIECYRPNTRWHNIIECEWRSLWLTCDYWISINTTSFFHFKRSRSWPCIWLGLDPLWLESYNIVYEWSWVFVQCTLLCNLNTFYTYYDVYMYFVYVSVKSTVIDNKMGGVWLCSTCVCVSWTTSQLFPLPAVLLNCIQVENNKHLRRYS